MTGRRYSRLGAWFLWAAFVSAMPWMVVGAAVAQTPTAQETALARSLFSEGVSLADAGDWAMAADRFERAYKLRASPVIAFNLAGAWSRTGRLVEATELLRSITRDDQAPEGLIQSAQGQLKELLPQLSHLTVVVEGAKPGLEVHVDGTVLPTVAWGVAAPADPGEHTVEIRAAGAAVDRRQVVLVAGDSKTITFDLAPRVATPAQAASTVAATTSNVRVDSSEQPLYKKWWLWTAVGAVVVAGVLTAVLASGGEELEDPVSGDTVPPVITTTP